MAHAAKIDTMNRFPWDPAYAVGHEALDAQHQQLLACCEALVQADEPDNAGFNARLKTLLALAEEHFDAEAAVREPEVPAEEVARDDGAHAERPQRPGPGPALQLARLEVASVDVLVLDPTSFAEGARFTGARFAEGASFTGTGARARWASRARVAHAAPR